MRLLQINLNHARCAQDMMYQYAAERGYEVVMVAEPYKVPEHPNWVGSQDGSAAIYRTGTTGSPPLEKIEIGEGYAAIKWGPTVIISCYAPPRWDPVTFERFLDRVGVVVQRATTRSVIVAGDFNAKSPAWGCNTPNGRGRVLLDWAVSLGLSPLNRGRASTCVRPQGESIVDVTFGSQWVAHRMQGWRVSEIESLSDHQYIEVVVGDTRQQRSRPEHRGGTRRWALTKLDEEALDDSLRESIWRRGAEEPGQDLEYEVKWLRGVMEDACNASMPRTKSCPRRAAYWWTDEIANLRRESTIARRRLKWLRARNRSPDEMEQALATHREAKNSLCRVIRKTRASCWDEWLQSLNSDPWGRPYRTMVKGHRQWAPPATETLEPHVLNRVVSTLFPIEEEGDSLDWGPDNGPLELEEDVLVTEEEIVQAVRKMGSNKAPGPDGVPGRLWVRSIGFLKASLRHVFNLCLRQRAFPREWKEAKLVLLPKEGKEAGTPSAYRPICLLDEVGKIFERIIASRLVQHLSQEGRGLHEEQYGFREGRSTIDAILRVKSLTEAAMEDGRVALAVSLDIANAFNTLPWRCVGAAMRAHAVPQYLVEITRAYFRERKLEFVQKDGLQCRRGVGCGVPQGSVLGPLLWDLAYNHIIGLPLPHGCHAICYADDTLVVAVGDDWGNALARAEIAVAQVVRSITDMGLRVAEHKTEALYFYSSASGKPPLTHIRVGNTRVLVGDRLKYLGLLLDGKWRFGPHFEALAPRVQRMSVAMGRLLPNLGGPDGRVRRLYMATLNSVAMYGAPIWAPRLAVSGRGKVLLRRVQRSMATRVARTYRTVSHAAGTLLAGWPPLELLADMYSYIYKQERELRGGYGNKLPGKVRKAVRLHARRSMVERWNSHLSNRNKYGRRTVEAIRPCLEEWLDRAQGEVTFRLAQILTGHGCFGDYLCRIGRELTTECHHCGAASDTAQHTLAECPAWTRERRELAAVVGGDFSLPVIVARMAGSENAWKAVSSFCEVVMKQKEEAERLRRREEEEMARRLSQRDGEESEGSGGGVR